MTQLITQLKRIPRHILILTLIVLAGVFLRCYNFHGWLDFGSDQVNDAARVGAVVEGIAPWPEYGPDMSKSGGASRTSRFRLGPMYYYFEIVSAEMFGNTPDAMAYPDALFGLLALPLLYYFLRRYFSINSSLGLTGLYTVSFYSLAFSHSAWNPNSIPFFTLLFLLALLEFLDKRERVSWWWVAGLGVTLGVGVQLHAILLVLFPVTAFGVFLVSMRRDRRFWRRWAVVFGLFIVLNLGQIIGESRGEFRNSRIFLSSLTNAQSDQSNSGGQALALANDVACHLEANMYILTAVGTGDCGYDFVRIFQPLSQKSAAQYAHPHVWLWLFMTGVFSVSGYGLLIYRFRKEQDPSRRRFLGLTIFFSAVSFVVLFPVLAPAFRYFAHMLFLPLIFVGLFMEMALERYPRRTMRVWVAAGMISAAIVVSNLLALSSVIRGIEIKDRIVLGQVEDLIGVMAVLPDGSAEKWYYMETRTAKDFFKSLQYVAKERGVTLLRAKDASEVPAGKPFFSIDTPPAPGASGNGKDTSFDAYRVVGSMAVYRVRSSK